jgi:hypothetical protein
MAGCHANHVMPTPPKIGNDLRQNLVGAFQSAESAVGEPFAHGRATTTLRNIYAPHLWWNAVITEGWRGWIT